VLPAAFAPAQPIPPRPGPMAEGERRQVEGDVGKALGARDVEQPLSPPLTLYGLLDRLVTDRSSHGRAEGDVHQAEGEPGSGASVVGTVWKG